MALHRGTEWLPKSTEPLRGPERGLPGAWGEALAPELIRGPGLHLNSFRRSSGLSFDRFGYNFNAPRAACSKLGVWDPSGFVSSSRTPIIESLAPYIIMTWVSNGLIPRAVDPGKLKTRHMPRSNVARLIKNRILNSSALQGFISFVRIQSGRGDMEMHLRFRASFHSFESNRVKVTWKYREGLRDTEPSQAITLLFGSKNALEHI